MLGAGGLKGLCGGRRVFRIDLVGRAQANNSRAGSLERGGERRRVGKALRIDRLDAAGLEKALGEGGARGEVGGRAEIGEEDPLGGQPVDGMDKSTTCPPRPQETKAVEADI